MNGSPIMLTLYNENDEVKAEYQKLIVPWGMLKRALKFKNLKESTTDEKTFDEVAGFVCELFNNKITLKDIEDGADISDVYSVIRSVVTRASTYFPNAEAGK